MKIPTYTEARDSVASKHPTPLDIFVHEHEPAGILAEDRWRGDLVALMEWVAVTDNAALRAQLAQAESRATRAEAELAEERAFHGECPGGCGYWKEAAKMREGERDEARDKCCRWRPISEAPRDGTHILAWDGSRSAHHFDSHPPTVVHWFEDGFYPSVSEIGNQPEYRATVWAELDERPAIDAALAKCGEGE